MADFGNSRLGIKDDIEREFIMEMNRLTEEFRKGAFRNGPEYFGGPDAEDTPASVEQLIHRAGMAMADAVSRAIEKNNEEQSRQIQRFIANR